MDINTLGMTDIEQWKLVTILEVWVVAASFFVVDSKKWISEEYLNEKLTLQVLLPPGVEVQSLLEVMILP